MRNFGNFQDESPRSQRTRRLYYNPNATKGHVHSNGDSLIQDDDEHSAAQSWSG